MLQAPTEGKPSRPRIPSGLSRPVSDSVGPRLPTQQAQYPRLLKGSQEGAATAPPSLPRGATGGGRPTAPVRCAPGPLKCGAHTCQGVPAGAKRLPARAAQAWAPGLQGLPGALLSRPCLAFPRAALVHAAAARAARGSGLPPAAAP